MGASKFLCVGLTGDGHGLGDVDKGATGVIIYELPQSSFFQKSLGEYGLVLDPQGEGCDGGKWILVLSIGGNIGGPMSDLDGRRHWARRRKKLSLRMVSKVEQSRGRE